MAREPEKRSIEDIIGGAAADDVGREPAPSPTDAYKELADKVDLLSADFGQWTQYKAASVEYVKEFTLEVKWHRKIRLAVAVAGALMVIVLIGGLALAIYFAQRIFGSDPGHSLTALIVSAIGGSVVITVSVARGAFATMADRNAGLPVPEHIKAVVEAAGQMFGPKP